MHQKLLILKNILLKEKDRRKNENNKYDWDKNSRENQKTPDGNWRIWLILAGRGFGKTRTGAETIRQWATSGLYKRIAIIGDTWTSTVNVIVEGVSGLLACHPPTERPIFEKSKRKIIWPNGAVAEIFSSEAYEQLRGPQFDAAWIDELAKFRYLEQTWNQLMLGLRLGNNPRCIVTTTPRPLPFLQSLMTRNDTHVTRGSTLENKDNLAKDYLETILHQFKGTRLAEQEIKGHILTSNSESLWTPSLIQYKGISL